jgi:anti-anti-sigma factor
MGKPYILVPRTQKFGEHVDDHQLEMADAMEGQGVAVARSPGDLAKFITAPKVCKRAFQPEDELCEALSNLYSADQYQRIMLVCSSGGHFKAMQGFQAFWGVFRQVSWVTFRTRSTEAALVDQLGQVHWAHSPTNRNIPNLLRNLWLSFKVIQQERPEVVISTGAGVAVPFLLVAKHVYGSQVVFVESKTRLRELSLSARLLRMFFAMDKLVVQSEGLANRYPEAVWVNTSAQANVENKQLGTQPTVVARSKGSALASTPYCFDDASTEDFLNHLRSLCCEQPEQIAVDMSATQSINGTGLKVLTEALTIARQSGVELVLWSVSPEVLKLLHTARLARLFKIEADTKAVRPNPAYIEKRRSRQSHESLPQRAAAIAVASLGLALMAVLFLPIAIAIKLNSSGPVLLRRVRDGKLGRSFCGWVFRTSSLKTASLEILDNLDSGLAPHVETATTPIGALLQKAQLDKLPLLWNVLRGEMTLAAWIAEQVPVQSYGLPSLTTLEADRQTQIDEWLSPPMPLAEFEEHMTFSPQRIGTPQR